MSLEQDDMKRPANKITHSVNNFFGSIGSVQQGDNAIANVDMSNPMNNLHVTLGSSSSELLSLLEQLGQNFRANPALPAVATDSVYELADEMQKQRPRQERIKELMFQIGKFATDAASKLIYKALEQQMFGK